MFIDIKIILSIQLSQCFTSTYDNTIMYWSLKIKVSDLFWQPAEVILR